MIILTTAFLIGIILPALNGCLLLRFLEGRTPVLLRLERWTLGFLAGLTLTMTLTFFLAVLADLPFTLPGFLAVQLGCLLLLTALVLWCCGKEFWRTPAVPLPSSPRLRPWLLAALVLLGIWTAGKAATGGFLLLTLPPAFDDTVKNWNFRGKIFYEMKTVSNTAPGRTEDLLGQLNAYPPAVSLSKAWLATLAGRWNEGLVDSVHLVWFLALLVLLYATVRRMASAPWAFLSVYVAVSVPLLLVHGTQAYAEVFLATHIFAALTMLLHAARTDDPAERRSFLRLCALLTALLPLTKNEGLVLYLPLALLTVAGTLMTFRRLERLYRRDLHVAAAWFLGSLIVTAFPLLLYKWSHNMTFGNAHALSEFTLQWQPEALQAMAIMLFFEGSWLLLFPLLIVLIVLARRTAFFSPLAVLTGFLLLAFVLQATLFSLTALSSEALNQTGFGRGLVHLLPVALTLGILLAHRLVSQDERT
ncbi:MAG: hypothetical protein WCV62_01260 [Candidatus Peribacteraceae bacterium]|jgi:hypothetical protein